MITITSNTAQAVRRMTNTETYPRAGLRIRKIDNDKFAMGIVPEPADSDVAVPGANVYLDRAAAVALEEATLDAQAGAAFAGHFILK